MSFSGDDKMFAVCVRNGPLECVVRTYDFNLGNNYTSTTKYENKIISDVQFMQKAKTEIVVAGEDTFRLCGIVLGKNKTTYTLSSGHEYEDVPMQAPGVINNETVPQCFTSFVIMENDQVVGISNMGDIFVIEVMSVVQVIDKTELVEPGTRVNNRLNLRQIVQCRYGFIVASDDVLYFFKFKPSPAQDKDKKSPEKKESKAAISKNKFDSAGGISVKDSD